MPRQARIDIPGLLQHVIVRGVARTDIFLDDEDREDFVQRLSCLLAETKTICSAWALLDNHVHLLLTPTEQPLARFMRRLLTGYAVVFNLRHKRAGHLFQNRYKSIVRVKAIICYLAIRRCLFTGVDVAKRLGYSTSAVSRAAKWGPQLFESNETLREILK